MTIALASNAQISYLRSLLITRVEDEAESQRFVEWLDRKGHTLDKVTASEKIRKYAPMPEVRSIFAATPELDEGMYRMNDEIFKVYRTQAGHLATKQLIEGCFEYTGRKPLHSLTAEHRMSLVEAQEYGRITGICCNCGRKLTNEESIEAGIGPICASKF